MNIPCFRGTNVARGRLLAFGFAVLVASVSAFAAAQEPVSPSSGAAASAPADPAIALRGSVWRTKAGIVFLKTPVGLLTLSSKTTLKDLKASQEVLFWLHNQNAAVDIRKKSDGSLVHRYFTGPMTFGNDSPKTLRWLTADGEETVHYGTQEERLGSYHEGDQLTVEVDDANTIVGVHDLQFDLQISQVPPSGSSVHVRLSGTVSKVKSNFVFLRTPVGVVMINSKIGIPPVKAGQPLTLDIDGSQVRAELTPRQAQPAPERNVPLPSLAPMP